MTTIFMFCALVGGTVLACQFVLTLVGLGDGIDLADDLSGDHPDMGHGDSADHAHSNHSHMSTWLFSVISFRTLVAAATFFGLAGMAAETSGLGIPTQLLISIASGLAAMYGVHWLMLCFYRLGSSGTLEITNTVGKTATVYIPIPESRTGQGKVSVDVQGRLEEFPAITSAETRLNTGAKVVVVGVVSGSTLEVKPQPDSVEAAPEQLVS